MLLVIVLVAIVLSILSHVYFLSISQQIDATIRNDLRRQATIEAFQVSQSLENQVAQVATNALTAANTPSIKNEQIDRGKGIMKGRQHLTQEITDRYLWLNREGKIVWSTAFATNKTAGDLYRGLDASDNPYFTFPMHTGEPYFSPVVASYKGQQMFISYPIFGNNVTNQSAKSTGSSADFKGVIVAVLRTDNFERIIRDQLSTELQSAIGIIDSNGTVVYSADSALIGEDLFGPKVQKAISTDFSSSTQLSQFDEFLKASMKSDRGKSMDFSGNNGLTTTVISFPIFINARLNSNNLNSDNSQPFHFFTLYLTTPQNVVAIVGPLVEQQRNFNLAIIGTIAAVTGVIVYVILSWNKKLEKLVQQRTSSLKEANEFLMSANAKLEEKTKELALANEQLRAHHKMQAEFVNIAAHELRTPIQPILGVIERLKKGRNVARNDISEGSNHGIDAIEITSKQLEIMDRNAMRLQKLSSEILDATRIEAGTLKLDKVVIDINENIRNAIADVKSIIPADQSVAIEFRPATVNELGNSSSMFVMADRLRIFEVVSNLVRNAIKFSSKEGAIIIVSTEKKDGQVLVSIKDQGMGISGAMLPKLFSKFAADKEKGGTGLGLFIAKNIVEAHGGRIWAENNPDNKGATFTFSLPLESIQANGFMQEKS